MTVAPAPRDVGTPVLVNLPHPPRYPLSIGGTWRATCTCHWWGPFATEPKREATR
jgi:hypothetical protein